MLSGSVSIGAGAAGATGGALGLFLTTGAGASRFSSLELQLEIPKAANNDSTTTVKAMRGGVHNVFVATEGFDFFIIAYSRIQITPKTITENEEIGHLSVHSER